MKPDESSSPQAIGRRLKEAMARRGVGNPEVAEALGVHPTTVSKWRRGAQPIEGHRFPALADFLRETEEWLRSGDRAPAVRQVGVVAYQAIPNDLRVAAKRFELEAMELGADDAAIAYIHHVLTGDPQVIMRHGGYTEPANVAQMKKRQDAMIAGLRLWLEEYLAQQREGIR